MTNEYYRQGSLEPAGPFQRTQTCPNCGAKIYPGGRFCSECGRPLLSKDQIQEILKKARDQSIERKDKKEYQEALQCLLEVLPLTDAENDAYTLNMTGLRYSNAGNPDKALEYYLKAFACDHASSMSGMYLGNIAIQYQIRNDFETADFYFRQAVNILKEHPNKYNEASLYINYARLLGKKGEYGKAKEYLALAEQNGASKEECSEAWASFR